MEGNIQGSPLKNTNGFVGGRFKLERGWTFLMTLRWSTSPSTARAAGCIWASFFSGNPGANRGAMQRRRPLNDTIPEIRRMKEERERREKERRERLLGKFSSGVLVGGSVRPFNGQVCTAKATSSNSHLIDGACKLLLRVTRGF